MTVSGAADAVQAAVERGLARHKELAVREVEAILDAAVRVAERSAPAAPRVADIVAEAGTSNQAFYRYFAGKDDLMAAVLERGMQRLHSYLVHQMGKHADPREQVAAWIRGILTQASDRTAARQSIAITRQLGVPNGQGSQPGLRALGDLLLDPIGRTGSTEPEFDTRVVQEAVMGTMRRHLEQATAPDEAECQHIVSFCLRGLTTTVP